LPRRKNPDVIQVMFLPEQRLIRKGREDELLKFLQLRSMFRPGFTNQNFIIR
jgi:hypothetical protein